MALLVASLDLRGETIRRWSGAQKLPPRIGRYRSAIVGAQVGRLEASPCPFEAKRRSLGLVEVLLEGAQGLREVLLARQRSIR